MTVDITPAALAVLRPVLDRHPGKAVRLAHSGYG